METGQRISHAIAQRIRQRVAQLQYQLGDFLESVGLHRKYLEGIGGKNGPTVAKLWQLKKKLGVSWDWLIEGVGDAPADGVARRDTDDGQAQIPERDIRVAAGPGQIVSEEETRRTWGMPQSFLQALSLRPEALQLVEIVGNSMYPLLWPGDIVLIDRRSVTPDLGAVYALWDGDAMYLISSENSAEHQSYTRRPEDVTIIGRVVWFGRRL